jgi:anti-sigma regulatory factor (Ser/Thr protein kinase)
MQSIRRAIQKTNAWALYVDDARAAVNARSRFVEFLQNAGCDATFIDKAELIFGELLGNVVRHAPGPVEITVDSDDETMILHVIDSGPPISEPHHRLPDDVLSERGRGLFIVEQLATTVQIERVMDRGNHLAVTMSRRV